MTSRDRLIEMYPELAEELRELPETVRLVDSDRGSKPDRGIETYTQLYVDVGEKVFELLFERYEDGQVVKGVEELPEL